MGGQLEGNCNGTDQPRQILTHGCRERDQTRVCVELKIPELAHTLQGGWSGGGSGKKEKGNKGRSLSYSVLLPTWSSLI